jgi:hypothetical protein
MQIILWLGFAKLQPIAAGIPYPIDAQPELVNNLCLSLMIE